MSHLQKKNTFEIQSLRYSIQYIELKFKKSINFYFSIFYLLLFLFLFIFL